MRDIARVVFHIGSLAWAVLGLAMLAARLHGDHTLLGIAAAIVFAGSGLGNLVAFPRPHPGGLMLVRATALALADLLIVGPPS